jgi:hypothetical protein
MGFHGTTTLRNVHFVAWQFSAKFPGFSPAKEQLVTSAYLLSRRPAGFKTNRSWVSYCPAALTWTNTAKGGDVRLTFAPGFKRNQRSRFSSLGQTQQLCHQPPFCTTGALVGGRRGSMCAESGYCELIRPRKGLTSNNEAGQRAEIAWSKRQKRNLCLKTRRS